MCLAPKMPKPPEPPPPPPAPVISPSEASSPTTVKPTLTKRASLQQASRGTSSLTIPLATGGAANNTPATTNLTIGGM